MEINFDLKTTETDFFAKTLWANGKSNFALKMNGPGGLFRELGNSHLYAEGGRITDTCPYWFWLGCFDNEKNLLHADKQLIPNK